MDHLLTELKNFEILNDSYNIYCKFQLHIQLNDVLQTQYMNHAIKFNLTIESGDVKRRQVTKFQIYYYYYYYYCVISA